MSKHYGTMMGGRDALEFLDRVQEKTSAQEEGFAESFSRMKNRFAYLVGQAEPVELKFHKGKSSSVHNYWTCQNCGCGITYGVIQNFCWNCGHAIAWEHPRCLTGKISAGRGEDDGTQSKARGS